MRTICPRSLAVALVTLAAALAAPSGARAEPCDPGDSEGADRVITTQRPQGYDVTELYGEGVYRVSRCDPSSRRRAGRRVSLWTIRHGYGERPRRLATVSTGAAGHLRLRTRTPARAGSYEVWARTASDAGGRPEHSCSMAFQIPYAG